MANRIPQQFLDQLLARTDIVELIDNAIPLKKMGTNLSACCPFHQEKTPSFTVSSTKQFYHCFGCGAHGNAISFLMEYERLSFLDAVDFLARQAGLEVPKTTGINHKKQDNNLSILYDISTFAANFYYQQLSQNTVAIDYLKKRKISGQIAKKFQLGFAPKSWDNLLRAGLSKGFTEQQLRQAGLVVKNDEGNCYDRFRNRIMFPIHDRRGRVIAFGGRVMDDSLPKYLNSPETPIFQKGHELYGLYEARKQHHQLPQLLLVEGYMDVLALAQAGLDYAVATLGTATTSNHLKTLCRQTQNIIFCFDGDNAGRNAAWRAVETVLPLTQENVQIHFMFLPEKEDPDSLILKEGLEAFQQRITQATSLANFFLDSLSMQADLSTLDGRAKLAKIAGTYLDKMPEGIFKRMLSSEIAKITRMNNNEINTPAVANTRKPFQKKAVLKRPPSTMRNAITLLIQNPNLAHTLPHDMPDFSLPGSSLLTQLFALLQQHPDLSTGALMEHFRDTPEGEQLALLACTDHPAPLEGIQTEFKDTIARLINQQRELDIEAFMAKAATSSGLNPDEKQQLKQLIEAKSIPLAD